MDFEEFREKLMEDLAQDLYEAVENCEFNKALELAKVYFSKTYSAKPIYELLSDGANRIMEEIKY